MIELERRVLLKHYLDQGLTKTAIAERLGISRRTIHHWIQTGQLERDLDRERVRYKPRPPVATTLDPYKPIIRQRLETYPELTAVRLFEEVKAAGYPGCLTQLKVFVRQIRPRPSQTQPSFDAWIPRSGEHDDLIHHEHSWARATRQGGYGRQRIWHRLW